MSDVQQQAAPVENSAPQTKVHQPSAETPAVGQVVTPLPSHGESPDQPGREDINFSSRFAALTKKEREVQRLREEAKQKLADPEYQSWQAAKKERNPIKALQALGFKDMNEAAQFVVNDGKLTPEQKIEEIERRLEAEKAEKEALAAQQQKKYIEDTISEHKRAIKAQIDTSGDTFELIQLHEAYDQVYEVIEGHFEATGELMPIQQAAERLEAELLEYSKKLLTSKKLSPPKPPVEAAVEQSIRDTHQEPKTAGSKTLTNTTVIATPQAPQSARYLSDDESKAQAAEFLRRSFQEQQRRTAN